MTKPKRNSSRNSFLSVDTDGKLSAVAFYFRVPFLLLLFLCSLFLSPFPSGSCQGTESSIITRRDGNGWKRRESFCVIRMTRRLKLREVVSLLVNLVYIQILLYNPIAVSRFLTYPFPFVRFFAVGRFMGVLFTNFVCILFSFLFGASKTTFLTSIFLYTLSLTAFLA